MCLTLCPLKIPPLSLLLPWSIAPFHVFHSPSNWLINPFSHSLCLHLSNTAISKVTNDIFQLPNRALGAHFAFSTPLASLKQETPRIKHCLLCAAQVNASRPSPVSLAAPSFSISFAVTPLLPKKLVLQGSTLIFLLPLPWISLGNPLCFRGHKTLPLS